MGCAAGFRFSLAILVIGLLPGLLVAQVPRPGDDRPELPDFVEGEGAATWSLPTIVAQVDARLCNPFRSRRAFTVDIATRGGDVLSTA